MAFVPVPKDLSKVKTKVLFNLTKRQLICFGIAALVAVPLYFLARKTLDATTSAMIMIIAALPFFFFAMYEKDGQPLEKVLRNNYRQKYQRPKIRVYRTENRYAGKEETIEQGKTKHSRKDKNKRRA